MYADRFTGQSRFNPGGLAAALGINAAVVAALLVAAPHVGIADPPDAIEVYAVPVDPPPPEPRPLPRQAPASARPAERIEAVTPLVDAPTATDGPVVLDPLPPLGEYAGRRAATGSGPATEPVPPPPVIVAPSVDPRYADDLQPAYPAAEQRLDREGKVTVRILVGADGRVRQVERVSATSDAFFRATEGQALRRWRFRPGTRDGVAEAAWRTMTVTFVLGG